MASSNTGSPSCPEEWARSLPFSKRMGVSHPHFMAQLTILTELVGGFAVILGAFVAIVSLPMAAVLLVAMFTVHLPYGFSAIKLIGVTAAGAQFGPPGYEVDLLYIACLATLVVGGAGPFAVDRLIGDAFSNRLRQHRFATPRRSFRTIGSGAR
ncbi:MAG: DoxX family protein [Candidatus Binatus sp.]